MHADALRGSGRVALGDRIDQLRLSADDSRWISGMWCTLAGQPAKDGGFLMAARWWSVCGWNMAQFWDIVARYRLEPGTRALLEAMLAAGQPELRLNTPVARVADDGKSVRVTTRSGETFSA